MTFECTAIPNTPGLGKKEELYGGRHSRRLRRLAYPVQPVVVPQAGRQVVSPNCREECASTPLLFYLCCYALNLLQVSNVKEPLRLRLVLSQAHQDGLEEVLLVIFHRKGLACIGKDPFLVLVGQSGPVGVQTNCLDVQLNLVAFFMYPGDFGSPP